MLFRKIGRLLRGDATPVQLIIACIGGALMGFIPSFGNAPVLFLVCLFVLVILNGNLAMAALSFACCRLLSLLLLPVTFRLGMWLMDGSLKPFFSHLINSPVTALMGFEYYVTTGGLVDGLITGLLLGFSVAYILKTFRKKMAAAEKNEQSWIHTGKKGWVVFFLWLLFGGRSKENFDELLSKKGRVIRWPGVAVVCVLIVLFSWFWTSLASPFIKKTMKTELEKLNGATVDIESIDLNLGEGRLDIRNIAFSDPQNLTLNSFSAGEIKADISGADLLRKRMRLDSLIVLGGEIGGIRKTPGKLLVKQDLFEDNTDRNEKIDAKKIEDYLSEANTLKAELKKWKARIEKMKSATEKTAELLGDEGDSLEDILLKKAALMGYQNVKADHLIEGSPLFAISQIEADNVKAGTWIEGETLSFRGKEFSTQPHLNQKGMELHVVSSKKSFFLNTKLDGLSARGGKNTIEFDRNNLKADNYLSRLKIKDEQTFTGGVLSLDGKGVLLDKKGLAVDLTVNIMLSDSIMSVPKLGERPVKELSFPVYLSGQMDNPDIKVDTKKISTQLKGIWKDAVKEKLDDEKKKLENKARDKVEEKLGESATDLLEGLFKKKKKK